MKAKCTGGEIQEDGRWVVYLEVPEGTHIQIDEEWDAAPVAAGQPAAMQVRSITLDEARERWASDLRSCNCPAQPGEDCPLTVNECLARQRTTVKSTATHEFHCRLLHGDDFCSCAVKSTPTT